jgi:putative chitinase
MVRTFANFAFKTNSPPRKKEIVMPVLQQGSTGPAVKDLQQKLKDLGFDPNGIDGVFGPGTTAAVKAFQQSKGLQVDGIAGPATLAALESADGGSDDDPGGGDVTDTKPAPVTALDLSGLTGKVPANVIAQIPGTAAEFGISTKLRLAHFLAQCALESTGFTATVENLNYSAPRILVVFRKYFKTVSPAAYAHNPVKLGSRVYANRMGNGDEASGDGFTFRGRGYIQLTGKNNYRDFSNAVDEDCVANPDLVATKYPLSSAAFFFSKNNIWAICDRGADVGTVRRVSVAVNGADPPNGLAERIQNFERFIQAL